MNEGKHEIEELGTAVDRLEEAHRRRGMKVGFEDEKILCLYNLSCL